MNIQQLIQQSYQALQQGQAREALKRIKHVLQQAPNDINALHVAALACQAGGDVDGAIRYYEKSLLAEFNQPQLIQNFTNFLLGIAGYDRLISVMERAVQRWPGQYKYYIYLGISLKELKRFEEAVAAYDQALRIKPGDTVALHNKGVALRMYQHPNEALECYQQIKEGDKIAELRLNRGCAYADLLELEKSETEFLQAIQLNPALTDAHENLNKLYWEIGEKDKVMQSYTAAGLTQADSEQMRLSYIGLLSHIGEEDQAKRSLKEAQQKFGDLPSFQYVEASLCAADGDYLKAKHTLQKAVDSMPHEAAFHLDMAKYNIYLEEYEKALGHLDQVENITPDDQTLWAYRGICWKLLGDARHDWLNNYDLLVRDMLLPVPEGYDDRAHFIRVLADQIATFHKTKHHPLDQSLRHGTQSSFFLLGHESQVIQDLKKSLTQAVAEYLAPLPADGKHPFLRRVPADRGFTFSGSWSVRLKSEGFHVNHMHPEGWLSGPSYIEVPDVISPNDPARGGWVKFGETGLNLGDDKEEVAKAVCPQAGHVVFFPSYIWHGTYPFESEEMRTTAPIDVMPA